MKRLFIIFGVLVILVPAMARAQSLAPLSPAVATVIERAQKGITASKNQSALATYFDWDVLRWSNIILAKLIEPVDTREAVIREEEALARQTACLRYDRWVIEQTMYEVQQLLEREETRQNIFAIFRLEDVYFFLTREHAALLHGALTPGVFDQEWLMPLLEEKETDIEPRELCFFSSDYAPPSPAGYGCDADRMDEIFAHLPSEASGFRESIAVERDAAILAERSIPGRRHQESQSGCIETNAVGSRVILHAKRGAFSLEPDDADALFAFQSVRTKADEQRPVPEGLSLTGDQSIKDLLTLDPLTKLKTFTAQQAALESATFAAGADPGLSQMESFLALRTAIGTLVKLGNTISGGLRGFVANFTGFLGRSCTDRPCNARLGLIQKLALTDACFPYGNGKYLTATPDNPQWKQCLCEAAPEVEECTE